MNIRRIKNIAIASLTLVLGLSGIAWAGIQYPAEGGTWEYGKRNARTIAYSYYTVDRVHGSSITRDGKIQASSIWTKPGIKSIAEKKSAPWTSFRYHYRVQQ